MELSSLKILRKVTTFLCGKLLIIISYILLFTWIYLEEEKVRSMKAGLKFQLSFTIKARQ